LIHHDRAITRLQFPSKSKLFSAAEDSTISISRTRDWTVLSSIKAPIPKPQGRPSGDTAAPGEIPAGINDFAIHPSQKLMLSVGRGERCMRLWNLMTGKKAGVLNFERDVLAQVGEGKHSSGEGRRVLWDEAGENFVVGFERGAAVFGIDSQPLAIIKPDRPTKIHQMRFLPWAGAPLAFSTEDGRILFYDISSAGESSEAGKLPLLECLGQLGGPTAGIEGRIKDFEVLKLSGGEGLPLLFITASSDGAVRLWSASPEDFITKAHAQNGAAEALKQIGTLIATHETGERITCLGVFILDGKPSDGVEEATEDLAGAELAGEDSEDVESD
jgi:protein MAK11